MMSANVCGKFMFPNDMSRFEEFLVTVGADVAETSQFLVDYIPKKLVSSTRVNANLTVGI